VLGLQCTCLEAGSGPMSSPRDGAAASGLDEGNLISMSSHVHKIVVVATAGIGIIP